MVSQKQGRGAQDTHEGGSQFVLSDLCRTGCGR